MLKAWFYDFIQFFLGAHKARKFLAVEVGVNAYNSVLDLGCGNGMLPAFLADTTGYLGVDLCSERIGVASGRWPEREFVVADIFDFFDSDCYGSRRFELIISVGLLHHLDDTEARRMLCAASRMLLPEGKIVFIDPVIDRFPSCFSRLLCKLDDGDWIRTRENYRALISNDFKVLKQEAFSGLLNIPQTLQLLEIEHMGGSCAG